MARPVKTRRICSIPTKSQFGPLDAPPKGAVFMTMEEYETIRLIDLLSYTQEECAAQMAVARTTVQGVYNSAREKLADALVNGRRLEIGGGNYAVCPEASACCGKSCRRRNCGKRKCDGRENIAGGCRHEDCSNIQ